MKGLNEYIDNKGRTGDEINEMPVANKKNVNTKKKEKKLEKTKRLEMNKKEIEIISNMEMQEEEELSDFELKNYK
jgi:hemerythrin superfamily protein